MKRKLILAAVLVFTAFATAFAQIEPDGTYVFAVRDTCDLKLDFYKPASGSVTTVDGIAKPTVLFAFGGGFFTGSRNDPGYSKWFRELTNAGYPVVSIDYRLGLKNVKKMGVAQAGLLRKAIMLAVEDMFDATAWLLEHQEDLGIDARNIVISGSSAGAITCLQSVYELSNRSAVTRVLPADYNYAGVMSFSGAVFSVKGKLRFKNPPCPTMMFHGTADQIVPYGEIRFLNIGFFGSDKVARRYAEFGHDYTFYRHLDHGHEIAGFMAWSLDEQFDFMENVVMRGRKGTKDEVVNSTWFKYTKGTAADLYRDGNSSDSAKTTTVTVNGPWVIDFLDTDAGAPESVRTETLAAWDDSDEPGIKGYSGTAAYTSNSRFNICESQEICRVEIDLGEVYGQAEVFINGMRLGKISKSPYVRNITKACHPGENAVYIKVTNRPGEKGGLVGPVKIKMIEK